MEPLHFLNFVDVVSLVSTSLALQFPVFHGTRLGRASCSFQIKIPHLTAAGGCSSRPVNLLLHEEHEEEWQE